MNLTRTIISLIIVCTFMPLGSLALRYSADIRFDYDQINDEIAMFQLRELLLLNYDMNVQRDALLFRYQDKDFRLSLVNGKLILQPGTQIFLSDIDDLYFDIRNGCIYVLYEKNNKQHEKALASQRGIYLDEFSDCLVSDDIDNNDEE